MSDQKTINIIGWGLAGATLAWQLFKRKVPFQVYDNGVNFSSRVAAGLVNPIVFKRLTKSWKADILLPFAKDFYSEIEEITSFQFLSNRSIARVFASVEEQNNWASLSGDERFASYLSEIDELNESLIQAPFGIGRVITIGNLDVNAFLDRSKDNLIEQGVTFINRPFNSKMIDQDEYVFCEGYKIIQNPFFGYIPMKPTHGDVLTIRSDQLRIEDIVNKNMFILPLGDGLYRVGATYNWDKLEPEPTIEGKDELIDKLRSFTTFPFEVIQHDAGIRPTVSDRRPFLGTHPKNKKLHVFNGLGTKGVMIAPFYAEQMANYLCLGKVIDEDVDVRRFDKFYPS
ncbi:MAG: FAD-dependent oxidoreductase [Crocinitomicaceae bacterium]|nr:FAD-dependent oxidoreductase [Crocinitomicaceae bacterium]